MRLTLRQAIRRPRFLRAWWIEFPPRRVSFYRRKHPEWNRQWRYPWTALVVVLALATAMVWIAVAWHQWTTSW